MHLAEIHAVTRHIRGLDTKQPLGRVTATKGGQISISGLSKVACLGDQIDVVIDGNRCLSGEVVQIDSQVVRVMPDGPMTGLTVGARAFRLPPRGIAPCAGWLGRLIDANGDALDNAPLPRGAEIRPLCGPPPDATDRRGLGERLATGLSAFNTLLPIVRGQRIGLFAGSGVGKSSLLGKLATNLDCDVAVVALVGERGREVRHFVDQTLSSDARQRTVVVAATSDRPALERRRCVWTAMSIAEHFRDAGKSVLFLADSITRFAEAHREIAVAAGEPPVLRGYPPSTAQMITELCERAGPGADATGDITGIFSVLVQGSDMDEPIADILRGVLDGHVVLARNIAERGRYPAIDLLQSVSRSLPAAATDDENKIILKVRALVSLYEQNAMMIRSGLYSPGTDPELDLAVKAWHELDAFMGEETHQGPSFSFDRLRLILRRAGA